ncbi:MAG: sulfatase-like hydrolase/transferase [Verrucomicrobiota bacterium]
MRSFILLLLAFLVGGACFVAAAEKPNVLFILTDDQSPHTLGVYGNKVCHTPNIDRIGNEGMVFHDAHHMGSWSGAVCLPSRTMIMTGRQVWRLPRRKKKGAAAQGFNADEIAKRSMGAVFNAAGYDTFRTCKRGNTFGPANAYFTVRHDRADKRSGDDENGSAFHGDRAMDFLNDREKAGDEDPFLMFFGFSHPHDPRNGKPGLLKKYGAENRKEPPTTFNPMAPELPVNYLPAHPFFHGHPNLRDEVRVPGVLKSRTEAAVRNEKGREYACIENIDIQVGRVLDKLEELGQVKNTYVIFTSDHGMSVGRHGLMGKQNLYEHTWRVPFLVRGPGIKAGTSASGFIYLMDVLPTLCDLAGIARPEGVDGLSFRPVLEGKKDRVRDLLYGVYCGGTKPGMRSVKTADGWKMIKYDVMNGAVRETQLFNLKENREEFLKEHRLPETVALTGHSPEPHQVDLAEDVAFGDKRKEMERLLQAEMKRLKDPFDLWDQ